MCACVCGCACADHVLKISVCSLIFSSDVCFLETCDKVLEFNSLIKRGDEGDRGRMREWARPTGSVRWSARKEETDVGGVEAEKPGSKREMSQGKKMGRWLSGGKFKSKIDK